jgi:hypothetical protein
MSKPDKRGMDRRQFLRLTAGGVLAAGAGGLAGCGGGGGGGGGDLTPEQIAGALEATRAFLDGMPVVEQDEMHRRLLTFLRARTEIIHTGETRDAVWAVFRNGFPYAVFTNRGVKAGEANLDPDEQDAIGRAAGYELPRGTLAARLYNAMGPGFKNEPAIIGGVLNRKGYVPTVLRADLESLRNIGQPGVFYYSGHGGAVNVPKLDAQGKLIFGPDKLPVMEASFGLSTATAYNKEAALKYAAEILAGLLGAASCVEDIVNNRYVYADRFLITSRWVRRFWSFSQDSLVWISACSSASGEANSLVAACKAKGAGVYVGWSDWVEGSHAVQVSKFVIDRLLGTNVLAPVENPKQRPFPYTEVYNDLRRRGLHSRPTLSPNTGNPIGGRTTQVIFTAGPGSQFGLLAPSISFVRIDEANDEAVLYGIFGEPPADERAVLIGGLEAAVIEWTKDKVRVRLPRTGTGSSGDVEVQVRAHRSNIRRITEWNLQLRHRFRDPDSPSLKIEGPVRLRFRADVGEYRETPGARPKKALRYAMLTRDSSADLTASGRHTDDDCTITWEGQALVPPYGYQGSDPNPGLSHMVKIDGIDRKLSVGLALGLFPPSPWKQRTVCRSGTAITDLAPAFGLLMEIVQYGDPLDESQITVVLPSLVLSLNNAWGISAGVFEDEQGLIRLEWDAANPTSPPDPDAARSPR